VGTLRDRAHELSRDGYDAPIPVEFHGGRTSIFCRRIEYCYCGGVNRYHKVEALKRVDP
jgi:hypothetical protein